MSLKSARLPSLRDKIEAMESKEVEAEVKEVVEEKEVEADTKVVIKRNKKSVK